ncbi:hypothetical protein GCM10023334_113470 [Nonomuraea thailandensis]
MQPAAEPPQELLERLIEADERQDIAHRHPQGDVSVIALGDEGGSWSSRILLLLMGGRMTSGGPADHARLRGPGEDLSVLHHAALQDVRPAPVRGGDRGLPSRPLRPAPPVRGTTLLVTTSDRATSRRTRHR